MKEYMTLQLWGEHPKQSYQPDEWNIESLSITSVGASVFKYLPGVMVLSKPRTAD